MDSHRLISSPVHRVAMIALWAWQLKSRRADWSMLAWAPSIGLLPSAMPFLASAAVEKAHPGGTGGRTSWSFPMTRQPGRSAWPGHDEKYGRLSIHARGSSARIPQPVFLLFIIGQAADRLAVCITGLVDVQ